MAQAYTTTPRPETGMTNGRLGTWLFIGADFMFVGAFVSAYALLRTAAATWPPNGETVSMGLPFAVLALFVVAGVCVSRAARNMQFPRAARARIGLSIAVACGGLVSAALPWIAWRMAGAGLTPATGTYHGLYYVFVGLAWLHAAPLTLWTLWLAIPAFGQATRDSAAYANRVACTKLMWWFTALLWAGTVFLFCLV